MRRRGIRPAKLVVAVVSLGAWLLAVLFVWITSLGTAYWPVILGIYIVLWSGAVAAFVAVAVIAQASVRKRHGVFSHLRQGPTPDVRGGHTSGER